MNITIEQSTFDNHPLSVRFEPSIVAGCEGGIWLKVGAASVYMNPDEAFDVASRIAEALNEAKEAPSCAS